MSIKKVAIIGSALSGNKGAAAMLESAVQTVGARIDTVEFTLLSMYPVSDAKLNTYKTLNIVDAKPLVLGLVINPAALAYRIFPFMRKFLEEKVPAIKALSEADILLDQGGITFVDGREKFLIYNVASILPALFMKVPVFKCAQALGPFKNPINRITAKMFLPKMDTIVSRGRITHEHLQTLKLKNVVAGADYAFSLDITPEEKVLAEDELDKEFFNGKKVVGVSPSVVMQKKADAAGMEYSSIIIDFINRLTKDGYRVVLLPHSVRSNTEKTHNNDLPLCRDIYTQLKNKDEVYFVDKELDSQILRYIIGECDFFIASRFHAMVSSLAMKVPTIVIGWSHKYKEVLEMFELEEWAFGQDKLSQQYLHDEFVRLVKNEKQVRTKLEKHLPTVKKKSTMQADLIVEVIK